MAFDKEKFIKDAKAAGYGDDEINAELAASSSESSGFDSKDTSNSGWDSGRPALATTPGATAAAIPQAGSRVDEESKRLAEKKVEKEQAAPVIPEYAQNPLLLAGAAAAGGAAVMGWKTLKDKMANSAAQPTAGAERREPSMFGAQRLDEPTWSASDPQHAPLSQEEMMNRLRGLAGETSVVNEPGFAQATQAAAPAATTETPPAAPSQNLSLTEATDRMKNVVPAASVAPETMPAKTPWAPPTAEVINKSSMLPSGTTMGTASEGTLAAPVEPSADQVAAAKAAEEKKAKMPLFSDADKKAFTSEQRSVLQHMQYGQSPEEAKNLLRHFENTLPEGVKLSYGTYPEDVYNEAGKKVKTAGTSKGGFPEPKQSLLNFWNEALGTNHAINEKGNFDYKPTPEDVTKAHSYWSEKMANATTPAAKSIAEKGYATLGAMAKLAGVSLGALGAMHAYKTGKETGDWSDLGLLGGSLLAGASVPAQIAYQGLTYSKPLGETQEQLKQLGKQLEYAGKVGYGRGLVNPANAIPPPRHTMTNR